jgi:hypothetical protein
LLPTSPHLSLEVDSIAGESNAWSCDTERSHFDHKEIEEFMGSTSPARQSTERNCTGPDSIKLIPLSITLTQSSGENINNRIEAKN